MIIRLARHQWTIRRRFITYALIGSTGVVIDVTLFAVLFNVFNVNENLATVISISVAIVNNFLWNAHFNFRMTDVMVRRFLKFYSVGLAGLVLTLAIFQVFVAWIGWNANVVKILSLPFVIALQYKLNKRFAFRFTADDEVPEASVPQSS